MSLYESKVFSYAQKILLTRDWSVILLLFIDHYPLNVLFNPSNIFIVTGMVIDVRCLTHMVQYKIMVIEAMPFKVCHSCSYTIVRFSYVWMISRKTSLSNR